MPSPNPWQQPPSSGSDIASILVLLGLALLLVYLVTVLFAMFPLQLLLPEWQLRLAGSLRGGASFPIEGMALILIANRIDPNSASIARWRDRLRQLAVIAALGFLLLIPLQLFASVTQLKLVRDQDLQLISRLSSATKAVSAARTAPEFAAAVAQLPGSPPLRKDSRNVNLESDRQQLLVQLEPQIRQLKSRADATHATRLNQVITASLRDGLVTFIYALAFAAVARFPGARFSLLSNMLLALKSVVALRPNTIWQFCRSQFQKLGFAGKRRLR